MHMAQVQSWCNHGLDMARFGSLLHALSTPPAPSPRSNHPHTPPTDLHHHPHAAQSPSAAIRLPLTTSPPRSVATSRHQTHLHLRSHHPPTQRNPAPHTINNQSSPPPEDACRRSCGIISTGCGARWLYTKVHTGDHNPRERRAVALFERVAFKGTPPSRTPPHGWWSALPAGLRAHAVGRCNRRPQYFQRGSSRGQQRCCAAPPEGLLPCRPSSHKAPKGVRQHSAALLWNGRRWLRLCEGPQPRRAACLACRQVW